MEHGRLLALYCEQRGNEQTFYTHRSTFEGVAVAGLVFACVAPHGTLVVPPVAGPDAERGELTRRSFEELGRRMLAAQPDTIIVMTPHGLSVEGSMSLLNNAFVRGSLGELTEFNGNNNLVRLEFPVDIELTALLAEAATARLVPVQRVTFGIAANSKYALPLDWAVLVPLWFMGADWNPLPHVVIACPDRFTKPLTAEHYLSFGAAIRDAAKRSDKRVAFIASADLGHAHDPTSRFGYDPASAAFDNLVVELLKRNTLGELTSVDRNLLTNARTDAFGQLLAVHGALTGTGFYGEFLSYEVPTYFGMACAAFSRAAAQPAYVVSR